MDKAHEIELMLVWGGNLLRQIEAGPQIPLDALKRYVIIANEALELLKEHEEATIKKGNGRPPGTGMGDFVAALIAVGESEENAVRMVAEQRRKPADKVLKALQRHRAKQSSKNRSIAFLSISPLIARFLSRT